MTYDPKIVKSGKFHTDDDAKMVYVNVVDVMTNTPNAEGVKLLFHVQSVCALLLALIEATSVGYPVGYISLEQDLKVLSGTRWFHINYVGHDYQLLMTLRGRKEPGDYLFLVDGKKKGANEVRRLMKDIKKGIDAANYEPYNLSISKVS